MIAYAAADLIWATRIKSTAEAMGLSCRPVRSLAMLRDRLSDSEVRSLIVDLTAPDLALDLIGEVRERQRAGEAGPIRVVAFGPHVEKELFQRARDAGADEVIPRGAFDRSLPDILLALESSDAA